MGGWAGRAKRRSAMFDIAEASRAVGDIYVQMAGRALSTLVGKRLVHVTTVDMSLVLLLGPQLRAFAEAGMEVVGVSAPGPYVSQLESWGIRHEPLQHATRSTAVGQDVMALVELWRLFRRLKPDIVHTHNPKAGLLRAGGRPSGRGAGHRQHRARPLRQPGGSGVAPGPGLRPRTGGIPVFGRRAGAKPRGLPCAGPSRRAETTSWCCSGTASTSSASVRRQTSSIADEARADLGVDVDAVVVGTVARLVWQKGFHELFDAAERLRDSHPDIVFVVVGGSDSDKSDAISSEQLAAAARRGHIVFAGSRDDMEHVYPGFDLFVLPSHREGFPRSAMEAAACGLPVVATDIRGCRQVVSHGQSGLLVPLHDPVRLAAAIEELARDPARRREMGAAGRRKAEAEFDDQIVVAKSMEAYERVLATTSSTRRRTPSSATRPS